MGRSAYMKTKLITIVLTAALVLAACSNSNERPIIRSQELSGEVTIALNYFKFSTSNSSSKKYYETDERRAYMPIHDRILKFIEKHPKVTVKIIDTEWSNNFFITSFTTAHLISQ